MRARLIGLFVRLCRRRWMAKSGLLDPGDWSWMAWLCVVLRSAFLPTLVRLTNCAAAILGRAVVAMPAMLVAVAAAALVVTGRLVMFRRVRLGRGPVLDSGFQIPQM